MSYICPVCNGLLALNAACPHCSGPMRDGGRVEDYYGPYSPYRPIDDMKMAAGFADAAHDSCVHYLFCPSCGTGLSQDVQEWKA